MIFDYLGVTLKGQAFGSRSLRGAPTIPQSLTRILIKVNDYFPIYKMPNQVWH